MFLQSNGSQSVSLDPFRVESQGLIKPIWNNGYLHYKSLTVAKLQLWHSNDIVLWLGVTTTLETVFKGWSIRKVENQHRRGTRTCTCLKMEESLFSRLQAWNYWVWAKEAWKGKTPDPGKAIWKVRPALRIRSGREQIFRLDRFRWLLCTTWIKRKQSRHRERTWGSFPASWCRMAVWSRQWGQMEIKGHWEEGLRPIIFMPLVRGNAREHRPLTSDSNHQSFSSRYADVYLLSIRHRPV